MTEPILQWTSYSRVPIERSEDWFWGLIILAFFTAIISLIFGNLLLAVIIVLAAFSLYVHERRPIDPQVLVKIDKRGVQLNNELFTYEKIRSFWVEETKEDKSPTLILHYQRMFVPNIHVPIIGPSPEEVRQTMLKFGEEEKHQENFIENIFESLGF
ncbi:MAG: hypothetical protein WC537_00370 [Candidatus Paceibacterota bacterium]|jgi:hypothetical protein